MKTGRIIDVMTRPVLLRVMGVDPPEVLVLPRPPAAESVLPSEAAVSPRPPSGFLSELLLAAQSAAAGFPSAHLLAAV